MTDKPKIAIVLGSTRPGRLGEHVARWVTEKAHQRDDAQFDQLDVATFDLKLLGEPTVPGAANRQYEDPNTRAWGEKVDEYDGFIFVTPEYNHGVPAALKNAVDVLYPEWNNKAVGFVGYGADGAVRAVEQWRGIAANLMMHDVRAQVALSLFTDFGENGLNLLDRRDGELNTVFDQIVPLSLALRSLRG